MEVRSEQERDYVGQELVVVLVHSDTHQRAAHRVSFPKTGAQLATTTMHVASARYGCALQLHAPSHALLYMYLSHNITQSLSFTPMCALLPSCLAL